MRMQSLRGQVVRFRRIPLIDADLGLQAYADVAK